MEMAMGERGIFNDLHAPPPSPSPMQRSFLDPASFAHPSALSRSSTSQENYFRTYTQGL